MSRHTCQLSVTFPQNRFVNYVMTSDTVVGSKFLCHDIVDKRAPAESYCCFQRALFVFLNSVPQLCTARLLIDGLRNRDDVLRVAELTADEFAAASDEHELRCVAVTP